MKKSFEALAMSFVFLLSAQAFAADPKPVSLKNFHVVSEGVFRGARPTLSGLKELSALHVKTIIDLQGGDRHTPVIGWISAALERGERQSYINWERSQSEALGMVFHNFPLNSMRDINPTEAGMISNILRILANPENLPAYVHCEHGHDRTGLVIALHRVFNMGWTPQAAHDEMVAMGHSGVLDYAVTHDMDEYFYQLTGN